MNAMIKGWRLWTTEEYGLPHLIPDDDLKEHTMELKLCWCRPNKNEDGLYIHNSMDRRELYEESES